MINLYPNKYKYLASQINNKIKILASYLSILDSRSEWLSRIFFAREASRRNIELVDF